MNARPTLQLSLQFARGDLGTEHRAALQRHHVTRWIRSALCRDAEMTVRVVGAEEGLALHRDYRHGDHPTNVLTFDYEQEPIVVADLVLCAPVVAKEAAALGIPLAAHYAHLLVHGTLHAQGWTHDGEDDAQAMERRESEIMQKLGFADPYRIA
ncbi:rRNA maturation RNase YbeY [Candidatus Symbiobacter mobilis]|uniref:Endoribonuclease YbeY n=1 Tax=Candidatus Symbiobacter mobilis CR TaxID=946483 RepID=U5N994_9BURK|nr:rRNA maturation RNase YbeY [Candidatus Symbiobacter mobilis]AGX87967.1 hydrolase-like protein [Candidatus Symbiobacter mobilis CR]